MPTRLLRPLSFAALLCLAATGAQSEPAENDAARAAQASELARIRTLPTQPICGAPKHPGEARCHAHAVVEADGRRYRSLSPAGLTPADISAAYNIPAAGGEGVVVALVDAYDDPNAESDLAVYRAQFGLPPCTTANGCFRKVNDDGNASPLPSPDADWSGEISLDLDAVSAACPNCHILLVEANNTGLGLGESVVTAAGMGAAAISNSYGSSETVASSLGNSLYYNHPGILVTVSTGDDGYGVQYPAASPDVVAVGGTSLVRSSSNSRGWVEGAWTSGGSGCSGYETKPTYQTDHGCSNRTVADISAVADPNTGLAVYDTYGGGSGWMIYGGTSLSSPLVAAIFAHVGATHVAGNFPYANPGAFYDVLSGSNGSCGGAYLCTAGPGYDAPTGIGTPDAAEISSVLGASAGGAPTGSCGAGYSDVAGGCVPNFGCNSSGQEGAIAWALSALFAAAALVRMRRGARA